MKKLALCMIVKGDEGKELFRALESVQKYVDHVFITTTQVSYLDPLEDTTISHFPWVNNFAEARIFNFNQAKDFKYIMWLDSDDVVENAQIIPEVIKEMDKNELDAVYVDYNYEIDRKTGEVITVHPRERIIRNNGTFEWMGALHETLVAKRTPRTQYIKDFVVNHFPSKESRQSGLQRNIEILSSDYNKMRKEVGEGKRKEIDPRTEYYLGRCLYDTHTSEGYQRALELLQDYLEHSGWDEERAQAWNYLGNIFFLFNRYDDAIISFLNAIKEAPRFPTWYIMLGRTYAALKDFDKAEFYIKQGLSIETPNTALVMTPRDDKINALITLFMIYFAKRDMKKALNAADKLYQLQPTEENEERIKTTEKLIKWSEWSKALASMAQTFKENKQEDKIPQLIDSAPSEIHDLVYITKLRQEYTKPKKWSDKSIVYYAASDLETWSPKSLDGGIGGSEEAIIYLAKEWVKLGHEVTVYCNCGDQEGVYDGVTYVNYYRFNPHDEFNVIIGWRNPLLFKYNTFNAKKTILDLHDVPQVAEYTKEIIDRIDYIFVKSDYHRSLLPDVPDNKFVIVGNGIDLEKLNKVKGHHREYKMFYGSSYDRGLENMLKIWPEVKQAHPLAELHICYGWNLFNEVYANSPAMLEWKKRMEKMMTQKGIIHHGRVGKKELYNIAKDCGLWVYPTHFEEIHCITGAYAQALGVVPVVYEYAALTTTVQRGIRLSVDLPLGVYASELIKILGDKQKQREIRSELLTVVKHLDWPTVAKVWADVFTKEEEQNIKVSIITPTIRTGFWNIMAHNIASQTYKNVEWIIVDDYKENRAKTAFLIGQKYGLDIKYYHSPKRTAKVKRKYGLSSANNQGWTHSEGSICLWLQDLVLMPQDGVEKIARLHKRYPKDIIAPTDKYHKPKKVNLKNKVDWFDGETDVIGVYMRTNARITNKGVRPSNDTYELELNYGAIPKSVLEELNGFWEFYDEALGYDDTEIPYRAMQLGSKILVDESNNCVCLDHWEALKDKPEELGVDRTHNLNDPRFIWMINQMNDGKLPLKRDQKLDDSINLKYTIPKELDQEGAVKWMKKHLDEIIEGWQ